MLTEWAIIGQRREWTILYNTSLLGHMEAGKDQTSQASSELIFFYFFLRKEALSYNCLPITLPLGPEGLEGPGPICCLCPLCPAKVLTYRYPQGWLGGGPQKEKDLKLELS